MTETNSATYLPEQVDALHKVLTADLEAVRAIELRYRDGVDDAALIADERLYGARPDDVYVALFGVFTQVDSIGSELDQAVEAITRLLTTLNRARSQRRR